MARTDRSTTAAESRVHAQAAGQPGAGRVEKKAPRQPSPSEVAEREFRTAQETYSSTREGFLAMFPSEKNRERIQFHVMLGDRTFVIQRFNDGQGHVGYVARTAGDGRTSLAFMYPNAAGNGWVEGVRPIGRGKGENPAPVVEIQARRALVAVANGINDGSLTQLAAQEAAAAAQAAAQAAAKAETAGGKKKAKTAKKPQPMAQVVMLQGEMTTVNVKGQQQQRLTLRALRADERPKKLTDQHRAKGHDSRQWLAGEKRREDVARAKEQQMRAQAEQQSASSAAETHAIQLARETLNRVTSRMRAVATKAEIWDAGQGRAVEMYRSQDQSVRVWAVRKKVDPKAGAKDAKPKFEVKLIREVRVPAAEAAKGLPGNYAAIYGKGKWSRVEGEQGGFVVFQQDVQPDQYRRTTYPAGIVRRQQLTDARAVQAFLNAELNGMLMKAEKLSPEPVRQPKSAATRRRAGQPRPAKQTQKRAPGAAAA